MTTAPRQSSPRVPLASDASWPYRHRHARAATAAGRSRARRRRLVAPSAGPPTPPPLSEVQVIPLPGVERRIDHLAVDPAGKRLFVAALGNGTLEVLDVGAGKRITSIAGLKEPQGVAYLPLVHRIVVAMRGGAVAAFDDATYRANRHAAEPGRRGQSSLRRSRRPALCRLRRGRARRDRAFELEARREHPGRRAPRVVPPRGAPGRASSSTCPARERSWSWIDASDRP